MKRTLVTRLFLCACALTLLAQPASASSTKSLSELEKEKKAIAGEIKDTQRQINDTQAEMGKVEAEIFALDEQLQTVVDELEIIERTLTETEMRQAETEQALIQAQEDRDNQYEAFKLRMRTMYEYGSVSFLDVLFQAADLRDFLTRLEYVNIIARSDQEIIDRMELAEETVSHMVEEIARQKNTIELFRYTQTVRQEELEISMQNRQDYFDTLYADEDSYQELLAHQRETEKTIQAAYNKKKAEDDAARKAAQEAAARIAAGYNGIMSWPLPSSVRITGNYGQRVHPITRKQEFHSGVDIGAPMGTDIMAADGGEVIMSKYNGGYGNCVMIDHGGGISTLYGHASKLLVSVGQKVTKGQVIAKVGTTGVSTGPHLHFEVRINGNHTSPKPYLGY